MGQQSNKVQKRRRRANYLERKKAKLKRAIVAPAKPKPRKTPAKKKEAPAATKSLEAKAAEPKGESKTPEPKAAEPKTEPKAAEPKPPEAAPVDAPAVDLTLGPADPASTAG